MGDIPVPQDDTIRDVKLPARLYADPRLHRLMPDSVALEVAGRIGPEMRQRRNPNERRDAEAFMRQLLEHTPRRAEAPELARSWLAQKSRTQEAFWRPWMMDRTRMEGVEHWEAARADGKGVVIVFGHILAAWLTTGILGTKGYPVHIVVGPHYYEPMPRGYEGLALLHRRVAYGEKVFPMDHILLANNRPQRFAELLEAGEVVAVAFDAPGRAATPFLGRNVGFGGAPARLAFDTGSKVLPVVPGLEGTQLSMRFYPPLDPAQFEDHTALRAAIAGVFEPIVLAKPETVELAWIPCPLVTEVQEREVPASS